MSLSRKTLVYLAILVCVIYWIVIPVIIWLYNRISKACDPIRFNLQHVMIVGGSDGLGKEIVREVFKKGALVTIVGRSEAKL